MMRTLLLVVLAVALLLSAGPPSYADEDQALLERAGALLEPRGKFAALEKALGQPPEERRDLGFGCSWARFELFGEELTLFFDVVTWRDWVAGIRVLALGAEASDARRIRAVWGKRAEVLESGVAIRTEKREEMKRLRRAIWKGLGKPLRTEGFSGRDAAVKSLTDPLAELTFGTMCYEDGSPPVARVLANGLWQDGARDALRTVLVGANPEGRVYAAEALLRHQLEGAVLGDVLRKRVEAVLALDLKIRCCDGCMVSDRVAAEVVSAKMVRAAAVCRVLVRAKHMGQWYTVRRVLVHEDGLRMAERLPPAGVLACIPVIDRAVLPHELLSALGKAVEGGQGFEKRDGVPTWVIKEGVVSAPPKAVRDLLASLPKR